MVTHWSDRVLELRKIWLANGIPEYRNFMMELICQQLNAHHDWTLLDAGCGNGLVFQILPKKFRSRYTGVDFTPEMVQFCKKRFSSHKAQFRQCSLLSAKLPAADLIITQNVIQHIPQFHLAMQNIVSKAKKSVLLCERSHQEPTVLAGENPHRWRFNENEFASLLQQYGDAKGFGPVKVLGRPKTTEGLKNVVSVYQMGKRED